MNREKRLERLTEYFTPALTWELVDRAIAALEVDRNVDQVDGVPIWQIQKWCDQAIARLKKEEDDDNS